MTSWAMRILEVTFWGWWIMYQRRQRE